MPDKKIKILHITESYAAGVTTAINSYVKNSPTYEHSLFACLRKGDSTGEENNGNFEKIIFFKRKITSLFKIYIAIKILDPDIIHIHSTYAGFFIRLLPISKSKIIYTPHGFAFLRQPQNLFIRTIYYIEKLLTLRTSIIAGCGKDESNIAKKLNKKIKSISLINICEPIEKRLNDKKGLPITIGMVGRICPQKDFLFFSEVAKYFKSSEYINFVWIGGGDNQSTSVLIDAGVRVTGWLTRSAVINELNSLNIYFHSAAWDGFPVSVLEAAEVGLPVLLRDIGPFTAENLNTLSSVYDCINFINSLIKNDSDKWNLIIDNTIKIKEQHTIGNLSLALDKLYSSFY